MFCSNCGKKLPDGAKFCTQCGKQIVFNTAPQSSEPVQEVVASYLNEPIEYSKNLVLKPNEKVILRKEEFVVTHNEDTDEDYEEDTWILVLTDKALIYLKPNERPNERSDIFAHRRVGNAPFQ